MSTQKRQGLRRSGNSNDDNDESTFRKRKRYSNGHEMIDSMECVELNTNDSGCSLVSQTLNNRPLIAEFGIIERVQLKNFMCHAHLDFQFGSSVNFIVGHNGSGKSAVMTAIVVCLGGSACSTNRGTTLKNFIMSGKQAADVSISLRNCGPEAYKPEFYGARIVVNRRISVNGRNYYRLYAEDGRLVSEKRDDLLDLLDRFNIQVDNPVCILNQDSSRNFLNSKNPKSKYKLFLKATQLEQIMQNYTFINAQRVAASKIITEKAKWLPNLEMEVKKWKEKYNTHRNLDELREQQRKLRVMIGWAEFGNLEQELKSAKDMLDAIRRQTSKLVEKVEQYKEAFNKVEQRRVDIENDLKNAITEVESGESRFNEKKDELNLKMQMLKNARLEWQKIVMSIRALTKDHNSLEQRIKDIRSTDAAKEEAEKQARMRSMATLEEKRIDTETKYATTEHHCEQLKNCNSRYKEELFSIENEERQLRNHLKSKQSKLDDLEGSRTNHLRRFGYYVPDFINKINQAHRQGLFKQKPIGPLGAHIKLRDFRFSVPVEACIKPLLFAFCCDNHADERLLEKLFIEVASHGQRSPTIIVSRFSNSLYDISRNRVYSDNYKCILDVLDIDNVVVTNCLIDQRGVEGVLIIESNAEARRVMQQNIPRNCSEAFTASGDQIYPSPNFRYYSARNEGSGNGVLQENVEPLIASLREAIGNMKSDHRAIVEKISEINLEKVRNANEIKVQEQELMRMRQVIQKTRREIDVLRNIVESEIMTTNVLEEDLRDLAQQLETLNEEESQKKSNFARLKVETEELNETCKELEAAVQVMTNEKLDPLKELLTSSEEAVYQKTSDLQNYTRKLDRHRTEETNQENIYSSKCEEAEEWRTKCNEKFGQRLISDEPLPKLKEKYNVIAKRLDLDTKRKDSCGDPLEIQRMYLETKTKYEKIQNEIYNLEGFLNRMKDMMIEREVSFKNRREYIAIRVNVNFTSTLELKKFRGSLIFDHEKEVLEVTVETSKAGEENSDDVSMRSLQGLSGGERSFTTVAFLLALWNSVDSPFRMMDEFDIFMDMVTRSVSMDMILEFASRFRNNQFIILTPLDMTKLQASDELRIFKMTDPDRNQTTLPFMAATNGGNNGDDNDDDDREAVMSQVY